MIKTSILRYIESGAEPIEISDFSKVQKGDMPGDKIKIDEQHILKAQRIFDNLVKHISNNIINKEKIVISVYGGSGVGKSEIGSLVAHYFKMIGIGSYVMSGDNYPHRIPSENDAKRLEIYEKKGREKLKEYLGSPAEIDFSMINGVIRQFKQCKSPISLKRMGRGKDSIYYESINMSNVDVLILEWTHGNNPNLEGIDIPVFLNSTPEETLAHRKSRNRDNNIDSPFTTMVLEIEQNMLIKQAPSAHLIVSKVGDFISLKNFLLLNIKDGPMLNSYTDSIGGSIKSIIDFIDCTELNNAFSSYYILPSIFNTDLDRGFSIIDYELNSVYATEDDLSRLKEMDIDIKLDFVLNHKSVLSKEFQDIIKNGRKSKYFDFFINWNEFWNGYGKEDSEGCIVPDTKYIDNMFFRKPGLPILQVVLPSGEKVPFWNTFYQEVKYRYLQPQDIMLEMKIQYTLAEKLANEMNAHLSQGKPPKDFEFGEYVYLKEPFIRLVENNRLYLGQMDLNVDSPIVWDFYKDTLCKLSEYGAKIVRLDAFAYAAKAPGEKNFFNEPSTWTLLSKLDDIATQYGLSLLPEIHSRYEEKVHEKISEKGYMTYDFFLPGLIIDAFERRTFERLKFWIDDIIDKNIRTVNMLGCHDGIPLLDLKGLLPDDLIQNLIDKVVGRGGLVKDIKSKKKIYYQVNATYFSAIGEDESKMLLARAIQMFMPGKPQIWYLDLLAGTNDYIAVENGGQGAHKEINRTNLSYEEAVGKLNHPLVKKQIELIRFRNTYPAFKKGAVVTVSNEEVKEMTITWTSMGHKASLIANLDDFNYQIITD